MLASIDREGATMNRPLVPEDLRPARRRPDYLARSLIAIARAGARGDPVRMAERAFPDDFEVIRSMLTATKAAVSPASTSAPTWAGVLAASAVADFVASLAPTSAAAKLISAGMTANLDGVKEILIPRRSGS